MDTNAVLDIGVQGLWTAAKLAAPVLLTALVVAMFLAIPFWKGKYFKKRVKGGALHAGH